MARSTLSSLQFEEKSCSLSSGGVRLIMEVTVGAGLVLSDSGRGPCRTDPRRVDLQVTVFLVQECGSSTLCS